MLKIASEMHKGKTLAQALNDMRLPDIVYDTLRGVLKYMPRIIPIDYTKEMEIYKDAVKVISSAA